MNPIDRPSSSSPTNRNDRKNDKNKKKSNSKKRGRGWDDYDGGRKSQQESQRRQHSQNDLSRILQQKAGALRAGRKALPVYKHRQPLCSLVKENDVVLVTAETGSGKSTQIPGFLYEAGLAKSRQSPSICVTQPRRVAAMTVAKRVAEELGCVPGTAVGHRVRFDDLTDVKGKKTTRLLYVTDGMLLREATTDPVLARYSIVVLDEAHERSLQTDVLLGVVKRAMKARRKEFAFQPTQQTEGEEEGKRSKDQEILKRYREYARRLELPPLKVVVMSATLDIQKFQDYFPGAKVISISGRTHPVQVVYTRQPQDNYLDSALLAALQIHHEGEDGDILLFLPGQEDIENLASLLKKRLREQGEELGNRLQNGNNGSSTSVDTVQNVQGIGTNIDGGKGTSIVEGVMVCVLYAALPPEAQMLAFRPKPKGCTRKIVLATNIAETSVTLDGIRFVVDCGLHKTRAFSAATGMESLQVANISKAQATQRQGRAGRVSSGYCFRLYTEDEYDGLEDASTPEILRVNLSQVILQLKSMGVHDPRQFDFVTAPSIGAIRQALGLLYTLGAVDGEMNLTNHGHKLALLPLDPMYGHLLLQSSKYGCVSEILTVVAMLSAENIFYRPGQVEGEGENGLAARASKAHRRFASYEGDIPTLLKVYNAWRIEAIYAPKAKFKKSPNKDKLLHGDWCTQNFISGRSLIRAHDVRRQLSEICARQGKTGLSMDVTSSSKDDAERFFKCVCSGLFLQAARRIRATVEVGAKGRSGNVQNSRGRYKTTQGGKEVSIHPTSTMFGRNPAPKCVVFTELLQTKKAYIRGVTQCREEWLSEVAALVSKRESESGGKKDEKIQYR